MNGPRSSDRRAGLTSEHFSLNWQRMPVIAGAPVMTLAVAKRLLPRAVDRNTVRRIAREAYRSWHRTQLGLPAVIFIRLRRRSADWMTMPDGQKKRLWRSEIDSLLTAVPASA